MSNNFLLHVKSSIDKIMTDTVEVLKDEDESYANLKGVEVGNLLQTDEVMKGLAPALLWQFVAMTPVPRDPLYRIEFTVGVKTVSDAGNYQMAGLMNALSKVFNVGATLEIGDYSGEDAEPGTGYMVIASSTLAPQQYDHMSGFRFFTILAHGARTA